MATWLLVCSATPAGAQGASPTLDQVARALTPDLRIQVLDEHRGRIDGHFRGLSGSTFRMSVKGQIVEVPAAQISLVRKERSEPDGVLLGLGIGFAAGFSYVLIACGNASEHEDCLRAGSLVIGGPAAAAGAIIDYFNRHFVTVFERRSSPFARWRLSPILDGPRKGVMARIIF
jgi:hypothetical protein